MLQRSSSLLSTLAVLLMGCLVGCSPEGADSESPGAPAATGPEIAGVLSDDEPKHVLLIVIDTLRADHLSCYGYWRNTSPNMDALAERGVKFEQAIAQSSWTSPSMITMMTGQRLSSRRFTLPEDKPTLAELFKDAGYRTGAFVTNPLLDPKNGFNRGFDAWTMDEKGLNDLDAVKQWIVDRRDEDTFTWVHFTDPHDPYKPPANASSGEPGRLSESTIGLMRKAVDEEGYDGYEQQRDFIAAEVGRYDDEIVAVDRKVRELVATLIQVGRLDNSIIVITSDHGECLWQRYEADIQVEHQAKQREKELGEQAKTRIKHRLKQTHGTFVYQELVRVPLIISAPGLDAGSVRQDVAESVHLANTILALAGVQVEGVGEMTGRNLFGQEIPDGGYTMTDQGEAFISQDGWKLILPTEVGLKAFGIPVQLYNLTNDPAELHNLAAENPQRVEQLTERIEQRRGLALPNVSGESWDENERRNAQALKDLGYVDVRFEGDEDESEKQHEAPEDEVDGGQAPE